MTQVVTIASTKGGVGKTTLAANLGALLVDQGQRVLLVDADVQPTLSKYFPLEHRSPAGLTALATGACRSAATADLISRIQPGFDIVVSDDPEGKLQHHLLQAPDGRGRMHRLLRPLAASYDFVLIDTQGAVGPLQDAAVLAAHRLLSPIPTEMLSAREFMSGTIEMLMRLAKIGLPTGPLTGILYRMDRTRDARDVAQALQGLNHTPDPGIAADTPTPDISVLGGVAIPASVLWREAATAQKPIHRYAPRSASAVALTSLAQALFPELDFSAFAVEEV